MDMADPKGMKVVGRRRPSAASTPADFRRRALALQAHLELVNPYPKPRGFVFKAPTWAAYEKWRLEQENPRLW